MILIELKFNSFLRKIGNSKKIWLNQTVISSSGMTLLKDGKLSTQNYKNIKHLYD